MSQPFDRDYIEDPKPVTEVEGGGAGAALVALIAAIHLVYPIRAQAAGLLSDSAEIIGNFVTGS